MSQNSPDATTQDSGRLLSLTLPPLLPRRSVRLTGYHAHLTLLATIMGAPRAVPVTLWNTPLPTDLSPVLETILQHVAQRIPIMEADDLRFAQSIDDIDFLLHIPLMAQGIDTCNGDFEDYGSATCLIAHLNGFSTSSLAGSFTNAVLWTPPPTHVPEGLNLYALIPLLSAERTPLNGISAIIAMLEHRTGTTLLDACPSCHDYQLQELLEWTDDNLLWLEQDVQSAEHIMQAAATLEQWVALNPIPRLKLIWYAIRRAHHTYFQNPQTHPPVTYLLSADDFRAGRNPHRPKTLAEVWGLQALTSEADNDLDST